MMVYGMAKLAISKHKASYESLNRQFLVGAVIGGRFRHSSLLLSTFIVIRI